MQTASKSLVVVCAGLLMPVILAAAALCIGWDSNHQSARRHRNHIGDSGYALDPSNGKLWRWGMKRTVGFDLAGSCRDDCFPPFTNGYPSQSAVIESEKKTGAVETRPPRWMYTSPELSRFAPETASVIVLEVGLPLRCFRCVMTHARFRGPADGPRPKTFPDHAAVEGFDPAVLSPDGDVDSWISRRGLGGIALPTVVLWAQYFLDALAWGALSTCAWVGGNWVLSWKTCIRIAKGLCSKCAYSRRGLANTTTACPECGTVPQNNPLRRQVATRLLPGP